jgi:cAMP phosphodiesterase
LIANIKEHYDINEFFGIQVRDYKALAALYCLLEGQNTETLINPQMLVDNKTTILEHLTSKPQDENEVKDALVEEYSKYDKDLKLLTFKILLEKFNDKYKDLLPEQKRILKEFITSVNSGTRLRNIVNKELDTLSSIVSELAANVDNQVVKIKLDEVSKAIKPVSNKERIDDNHLVKLMQYYELVNELKKL